MADPPSSRARRRITRSRGAHFRAPIAPLVPAASVPKRRDGLRPGPVGRFPAHRTATAARSSMRRANCARIRGHE
jgi:hypothetical protein